jgi:hypothetical protein
MKKIVHYLGLDVHKESIAVSSAALICPVGRNSVEP